jgi:Predicted xylanase/chitin deacetylase
MMQGPKAAALRRTLKQAAIRGGLETLSLAARAGLSRRAAGRGVIFTLHHVRPREDKTFDPAAHLTVTPDFLDAAIAAVKRAGYRTVALSDLLRHLERPDDDRPVAAFTLDDGYRDNDVHARPVFERHETPFTVFVTGGFVDRTHTIWWKTAEALIGRLDTFRFDFGEGEVALPVRTLAEKYAAYDRLSRALGLGPQDQIVARLDAAAQAHGISPSAIVAAEVMDEAELRRLAATPFASLGAHTISHPILSRLDERRMREEISASIDRVEAITGTRPATFAYPYGTVAAVGPREYEAARQAGLSLAVTTQPDVLRCDSAASPFSLKRVSLNGYYQKDRYVETLLSGLPFALRRARA